MPSPTIVCIFTARLDFLNGKPARQADCVVLRYTGRDVHGDEAKPNEEWQDLYLVIEQSRLHKLKKPSEMFDKLKTATAAWEDFTTRLFDRSLMMGQIIFVATGTRHVLDDLGVGEGFYWSECAHKHTHEESVIGLRGHVDELGQALGELLVAAGVTNPDMPLTGPQLIGAAKHWTENLQKQAQAARQGEGKDLGQIK